MAGTEWPPKDATYHSCAGLAAVNIDDHGRPYTSGVRVSVFRVRSVWQVYDIHQDPDGYVDPYETSYIDEIVFCPFCGERLPEVQG